MSDKLNGWTKWAILAATALITIGIYIATVKSNTKRLGDVEVKAHTNEGDIRDLKKDITHIKKAVDRIEEKM